MDPIKHHLERIDANRNMARYYSLSIEKSLFGEPLLVRRWGRIGGASNQKLRHCQTCQEAEQALRQLIAEKTSRGYRPC